ncbi:TIGR02221 family CRISPR-associated protein [Fischerella thermalis]|uniref:TIGR02221 family CRISPR-associated protein n=1 Tax=Fischerella thermalis TaxID=372787 RepID=UPI000C7FBC4E|nr:TIGR02221 family CRISPR-associated protein [Fischerella thermalis]PLZ12852.1 CRISPR-associated protein [Fischerella thermalis WC114]PLZ23218.1 CRISPR-associated protein [Fischerella thermalis WC157]PLZ47000.1 CRISPR-associated protein [Fischerella thermalis WC441]PLZ63433.1 CRISPR-associated protein [Fischerella thermalis WC249]PLZ66811.1 CRISPR-associated protein [Fischerella thermalis WC246]
MAKILISPIGVGGRFKSQDNYDREYQEACYKIGDISYPQSRFMAAVLYEHFKLDGIVFIGTVKSMWEEVYRFFCEKNGVQKNDDYWLDLACKIDDLKYDSPLNSLDLSPIEEILGKHSKCILIKYGIDQDELWENFDRIFQIVDWLNVGDEIYIDITHSFRSLSLFLFLTVTFIKDLASEKQIKISGVYYGMLDVTRELKYTPVVDLNPLFEMTSWIKGAYSLQSYGNGNFIAELLKAQNENQLANQIEELSQSLNINNVNAIKQKSSILKTSLQQSIPKTPFQYLRKTLENFVKKFARSSVQESEYQLELAGWYFDNQRYATGYITLAEAIITYLCEIEGRNIKNRNTREEMKNLLHNRDIKNSKLAQLYFEVNPIRKSIAHALLEEGNHVNNVRDAINNAKHYYQEVKTIFKTGRIE